MFTRILAVGFAVVLALPTHAASITDRYTSFYTFGDSLSDNGKFGQLPATPPSVGGRFSNGKVWAEIVAEVFNNAGRDTGNLAVGGATAGDGATLTPLSNFNGQINAFLGALAFKQPLPKKLLPVLQVEDAPPAPGDNPLVSVWLGANDLFRALSGPPSDYRNQDKLDEISKAARDAAKAVTDGIKRLSDSPLGMFNDFLVANLPDLGATPAYTTLLALAGNSAEDVALASKTASDATFLFNKELASNLADLRDSESLRIINLDAASFFDDVLENPKNYPFASVTQPCTVSLNSPTNPFTCTKDEADALFFVDGVHPNRIAHQLIAERAQEQVAAVPLPASAPLVLFALGSIGFVARRRRAA